MSAKPKLSSNLVALRHDATKVIDDISRLSEQLKHAGRDRVIDAGNGISSSIESEIDLIRGKLADLVDGFQANATKVNKHFNENPFAYIAGAAGVAFLLGRVLRFRASN